MIIRENVVLNRTVVSNSDLCFNNLCSSHLHSQGVLYQVSKLLMVLNSGY